MVVYVQSRPYDWAWPVGFAIPTVAMVLSLLLLMAGHRSYYVQPPAEYSLVRVVKVSVASRQGGGSLVVGGARPYPPNRAASGCGTCWCQVRGVS